LNAGFESVGEILDSQPRPADLQGELDDIYDPHAEGPAYATGPEAVAQYGYDPKEVAAGMLLLHNRTHDHRGGDIEQAGIDRLYDIAKKRSEMQRAYEERQKTAYYGDGFRSNPGSPNSLPLLGDPTPELTGEESQELYDQNSQADVLGRVNQEFHDWAYENNKENPYDEEGSPGWHGEARGPVGYWPHVEDFLKEKYPAAHRGLSLGMEEVGYLMDVVPHTNFKHKKPIYNQDGKYVEDLPLYETGMDAVNKYGYDPKEIVAALMLLHNDTSEIRKKKQRDGVPRFQQEDLDRLHDIAARRYKMQRQYEEANGGRRSPRDDGGMTIPRPTIQQPCVWCGEEAKGHSSEGLCKQCLSEAGKTARTAMPVPRSVPSNHENWEKQHTKLNDKAQKAGLPFELIPNFSMDQDDFNAQSFQHEETGRPGGWYNEPVEYEGKGVPGGISHRYLEVGNTKIPVNYLLHHGDDGRINGILSHFPKGTPFEKPGSITVTVHPHHRDKGVGSKLLNTAVDKFGVDLEQQEYTPLGYELYRNVKHQQGETVPNIFNEKVAATDEPSLDSLQQSFRDFILTRKPIDPDTGQPHTPESGIKNWLTGVVPFVQAVHPDLPYERYRYEPHTRGLDDFHDIPATIEKLMALHTREKYGTETLLKRIQNDEIRQQSQTWAKDLESQFAKGYGMDNGKLVPMPQQPFATTPRLTPMPQRNPMPQQPPMSESDAMRLEIQRARSASAHERDEVRPPPEDYVGEHREPEKSLPKKLQDRYEKLRTEDFFDFLYNVSAAPIPGVTASRLTIAAALESLAE
jgi:hypothetical protein